MLTLELILPNTSSHILFAFLVEMQFFSGIFRNIWSKKYSFTYTETSVNMNNDENNECVPLFNSVFCDGLN